jgi:hypothetical protein
LTRREKPHKSQVQDPKPVILTSHAAPALLEKFAAKGIDKFIAHKIALALARERYGGHFDVVIKDLHESDDLRVLDDNGARRFARSDFPSSARPILHEPGVKQAAHRKTGRQNGAPRATA